MDTSKILEHIQNRFPKVTRDTGHLQEQTRLHVDLAELIPLLEFLKQDEQLSYELLSDILGLDHTPRVPRFDLVYVLYSVRNNHRLVVKTMVDDQQEAPTATAIWAAADWAEREVYDLMGIPFAGHPDLRRILTWDNFPGHPLRKEFPAKGHDFEEPFDLDSIQVNSAFPEHPMCTPIKMDWGSSAS